ncbi:hypothetical protein AYO47_03985 [Planctomyces sp. SCGC AG-212-M04]|nr:hypothetical protein AYO47_03985 [Planctomyces sp. SCGC AG-212-M04]
MLLMLTGCTAGPRASMFDPVGRSPVELLKPEADPFLGSPGAPEKLQTPPLPKLGPISSAARMQMWRAKSLGPAPQSLPNSIPVTNKKTQAADAVGTANGKHVDAKPTSNLTTDGQRGFVQIMPPPPDDVGGSAAAPRESRYFELPPAPEK